MRIKSYFADSVQDAIEKARLELGADAMLMNSRKTEFELRLLGAYEVVFGVPDESAPKSAAPRIAPPVVAAAGETSPREEISVGSELARELAALRRQIETVTRSVNNQRKSVPAAEELASPPHAVSARLHAAGFSVELASEIAAAVERRLPAMPNGGVPDKHLLDADFGNSLRAAALTVELQSRFALAPRLGRTWGKPSGDPTGEPTGQPAESKTRAVLFAGPAGAGKTASLIKLALRYGLRARVPLQILSLDTLRVGGWEQLASYARITGLPFDVVHTQAALDQALVEYRSKELILIDSPGFSPAELAAGPELADWLPRTAAVPIEVQLVLPASWSGRAARSACERFAAFRPAKLLFTHLDEAGGHGGMLETAILSGLPISFLAAGREIPEDIEEASYARLLESFQAESAGLAELPSVAA